MKGRASDAIKKLIGLQPKTARVVRGEKEIEIPISKVQVGDLIIVRPGEKIAVDGKIVDGESEIDCRNYALFAEKAGENYNDCAVKICS